MALLACGGGTERRGPLSGPIRFAAAVLAARLGNRWRNRSAAVSGVPLHQAFWPRVLGGSFLVDLMRALTLGICALLGAGFVLLGALVLWMGEAQVPVRGPDLQAFGWPAYAMGIGWAGLGVSIICVGLLGAEVGSRYHVRRVRDGSFVVFGLGFALAVA